VVVAGGLEVGITSNQNTFNSSPSDGFEVIKSASVGRSVASSNGSPFFLVRALNFPMSNTFASPFLFSFNPFHLYY